MDPSSQQRSSSAGTADYKDDKEVFDERKYAADLAAVSREQRAEARRIREMHGAPVAFDVRLDASNENPRVTSSQPGPHDPYVDEGLQRDASEPRYVGLRSNSNEDEYARGLKIVTEAMQGKSRQAGREEDVADPNELVQRRRRSWGAPVDLNDIRRSNQPKGGGPDADEESDRGENIGRTMRKHFLILSCR